MKLNSFSIAQSKLWLLSSFAKILAYATRLNSYRDKRQIIMRLNLSLILVVIAFFQASATGFAQKISLNEKNSSLEKIFETIRDQSEYVFMYNSEKLERTKITVNVKNTSIENALDACLKDLPFTYKIVKNNILIKEKEVVAVDLKPVVNQQQEKKRVNGLVVDSLGASLPGVTVVMKNNSNVGTTTDINGRYILEVSENAVLVFSMVGFDSQEVSVKGKTAIDVALQASTSQLSDVVVVAFGTQKKQDLVGSVTTINPSELKIPSSNLTTALAGRLAGVIAYQRSGEPGQDNADFFIRGVTTFGYKKDPLILIDGVEFTSTDLARLQPDDIASFSIMKDASAAALYGSRGANGVILVTTKEGKEGIAKVSFRLENSLSAPTQNVKLADPITYMLLHNEATRTDFSGAELLYHPEKIVNTLGGTDPYRYPATDWRKELFQDNTINQRANLNVSGGGAIARYYFAGTFNQDNGVLKVDKRNNFNNNIDLKSYLIRSNVNVNVTKSTEVGVRMYGSFDDYTGPLDGGADMYKKVMRSNPVEFPAYYPASDKYSYVQHIMFGGTSKGRYINPYADMVKGYRNYSRSLLMAQFELKQNLSFITEGLSFRAMGNTNRTSYFSMPRFYNPFYYEAGFYDPRTDDLTINVLNERAGSPYAIGTDYLNYDKGLSEKRIESAFYFESVLNYNRTFKEKHNASAMLVYLMQERIDADAEDLQRSLPFRNLGLSGRFTYSYDSRYFAEFNFGYNGSERFYKDYRFGFFPSGGVAWQVSSEKFWEPIKPIVSLFKLRATHGLVGNDAIGEPKDRFFYLSNVNMTDGTRSARFGTDFNYSNSGISINRYGNNDITWEVAEKTNIGLELKLFNKVGIQADFFSEYRTSILMERAFIPAYMGLSAEVRANVAEASGKGMDISLDYQHHFTPDFWITAMGNFTFATSKHRVYEEAEFGDAVWKSKIGYPLSQRWGYIAERLFVDDQEVANSPSQDFGSTVKAGFIKYRDVNGDGIINELDQVPIGNPTSPEIVYGFGFSMGLKNFDLSCFFQGLAQESFWIDPKATAPFVAYHYNTTEANSGILYQNQLLQAYADSHWSEENSDVMALWPRLSTVSQPNNTQSSTWFMRNGSFLRLKTAEFGYTFQKGSLRKVGMESIRVYASGINLLTLSSFKLWDVEMAGNGLGYPIQRVYNLGVKVSF